MEVNLGTHNATGTSVPPINDSNETLERVIDDSISALIKLLARQAVEEQADDRIKAGRTL